MYALSVAFLLPALALAAPSKRNMVVHESRQSIPSGFTKVGAAPADETITLRLALKQGDMAGLEERLYAVSTPSSAEYGKFLSKEQVEAFVAPKQDTTDAVNAFLTQAGLKSEVITPAADQISITLPVHQANELFDANFETFTHTSTGKQAVRALAYSLPADLAPHVEFVHPTVVFPQFVRNHPMASFPLPASAVSAVTNSSITPDAVPASCASVVTPACLQALYGIPTTPAVQASNVLGVSGFIEQFAQTADLRTFLAGLRPDLPASTTFTTLLVDGGSNPQAARDAGVEADLDTQYTVGVASGVPTVFISVGENNRDGIDGFQDIITTLLAENNPPKVLTTSYGFNEPDLTTTLANNLCNAHMQLGARGTSILFSSGDGGVSGSQSQTCTTFIPTFPSGCPFLTSVGATTGITETAADFSSGGFSNIFARPSYQAADVSAYLTKLGNTNRGKFSTTGRAFPDIAAQGENVEIVVGGQAGLVAGTSCSSPIFASVIALLNDRLISAGKAPLGFLNPFLYSTGAAALNDITTGSNPGCNTNGFPAEAGWDPVTGLGTPNFAKLLTAVGL
ncbi:subtilisin-like protein [Peniophora sp. CONT]|nr:subtilisin-like protein [Peniophora sp. CONT]